ncbi:MAG: cytochrome P450 [Actinomycetota bacterium]
MPTSTDIDLGSSDYRRDPVPAWERLRDEAPIHLDESTGCWIVSRYDDVATVLRDHETYSIATYEQATGAVLGPTLIQMDGPEHVWRRSAVAPDFVGTRLESWMPTLREAIDDLIERFPRGGVVDVVSDFSTWLPVNVIVAMLGFDGDQATFHGWVKDIMAGLAPIPELRERGRAAHGALCAHIEPNLREVEEVDRHDLIAKIARAESDGQRLDPEEVRAFIGLLFIAGGETTDKAIGNLWWNLLRHPEVLAAVSVDRELLQPAFTETMRLDAPVVSEDRFTTAPVEWHGVELPVGARIRAMIGAAHRDPTVFSDPDEFRLDRDDLHLGVERRYGGGDDDRSGHLGFGLGKHFCLGYQLARSEAVMGTDRLLDRLPRPRFADPDQPGPELHRSMRSLRSLPVAHDGA